MRSPQRRRRPPSSSSRSRLSVQTEPPLQDPRELQTLLTVSLRALWGDLEPYSASVRVSESDDALGDHDKDVPGRLYVSCPSAAVEHVRAALTWNTPPPYMQDMIYRLDVVDVQLWKTVPP